MKSDYLKYWKVVKKFIKEKHGLTESDLEMLLFLKSEGLFTSTDFRRFANLVSWDRLRMDRLVKNGWIDVHLNRTKKWKPGEIKKLYKLSYKAKRVTDAIYEYLEGRNLPMTQTSNPMMAKNVSFSCKVHRNFIQELNKEIKQGRHQQ